MKKSVAIITYSLGNHPSALAERMNVLYDTLVKNNIHVKAIYSLGSARSNKDLNAKGFNESKKYNIFIRVINEIFVGIKFIYYIFLLRKSDYFIVSSPPFFLAIIVSLTLRFFRLKYWLDIRDLYPEALSDAAIITKGGIIYKFLSWITNLTYKKAEGVLLASPGFIKTISVNKKYIFQNGFPEKYFYIRPKKYSKKTICVHGTFGYFQDVEFILELSKLLHKKDINLLLIGGGIKFDEIKKLNLPNVKIFDKVSNKKCIDIISKCHIGLSFRDTSDLSKNAFPVRVWEYLGLNIPCVIFPSFTNVNQSIKKTNLLYFLPKRCELLAMKEIMLIFKKNKTKFYMENNGINKALLESFTREVLSMKACKFLIKNS